MGRRVEGLIRAQLFVGILAVACPRDAAADLGEKELRSLVRVVMAVEFVVPDLARESSVGSESTGWTLSWPVVFWLASPDLETMGDENHWFALGVLEPQVAFGRGHDTRLRGLLSARGGWASVDEKSSALLEVGWHSSDMADESGAVVGLGIGAGLHSLGNLGLLARYYFGDEQRVSLAIDLAIPMQLWSL